MTEKDKNIIKHTNHSRNMCNIHKPMNKKLWYIAWYEWLDYMINAGHDQEQCPNCGRWLFKCEL